ncbi:MAG TPA: hypothetical protein VH020_07290 [Stellaceae bacterium]|jgi:hypothetical protein|nr:hypothetical protein [Stellaceae bacterium]
MSENEYIINGLKKLHADLHARLLKSRAEGTRIRFQMQAVERVIRLVRPGENLNALVVRRLYRPNPIFKRGDITRGVLAALRDAKKPLTADEICAVLLRDKGVISPTRDHLKGLRTSVLTALKTYSGKTVMGNHARPNRWATIKS